MKFIKYKGKQYPIKFLLLEYRPEYGQVIFIIATEDLKTAFGDEYMDWDCTAKSIFGRIHTFLPNEIFNLPSSEIAENHLNGSFKLIRER
jgi:hypothetical protein